jgi:CheY-like chemotaxis protein
MNLTNHAERNSEMSNAPASNAASTAPVAFGGDPRVDALDYAALHGARVMDIGTALRDDYDNEEAVALSRGTILVVDDDPLALELVADVAAAALPGYVVATQTDVAEAFAICDTRPVDCLIIDYDMPDVDGLTATRFLRTRHPQMPIVMFTGVGDGVLAVDAMRAGVHGYMPKHRISADLLRRTVTSAMAMARMGSDPDDFGGSQQKDR